MKDGSPPGPERPKQLGGWLGWIAGLIGVSSILRYFYPGKSPSGSRQCMHVVLAGVARPHGLWTRLLGAWTRVLVPLDWESGVCVIARASPESSHGSRVSYPVLGCAHMCVACACLILAPYKLWVLYCAASLADR